MKNQSCFLRLAMLALASSLLSQPVDSSSYAHETTIKSNVTPIHLTQPKIEEETPLRNRDGLVVLYDFSRTNGSIVKDVAGTGKPVDLKISSLSEVRRKPGSLQIMGDTIIRANDSPQRMIDLIKRTQALTIEAWIEPADTKQSGPARIVTLSRNGSNRNFTVGQDGNRYDVRLRTTSTSTNGIPSLTAPAKTVKTKITHLVYTRARNGKARLYLDGKLAQQTDVSGNFSNWDSFQFALGNEQDNNRQWRGTYHLVAVYNRDLSAKEVQQNYRVGANTQTAEQIAKHLAELKLRQQAALFESKIAPLIADRCLECHDSAANEGGLNLSLKRTALAGGESGKVIVAGKAVESLLWESIEADDMPADRPPLSTKEKELLKNWLNDGATWSLKMIDPAVYANADVGSQNFLRRLTVEEYIASVKATVDVDISKEARELIPPDVRADGFSNTAYNLNVDLKHVNAFSKLAELIVAQMDVKKFTARFSNKRRFTDNDMGDLIEDMGKWILRGPIQKHEVIAYRGISTTVASSGGEIDEASSYIIEAMLQSPRFLYRVEDQRGDGSQMAVSDYELATRISYIVWGSSPDNQLFQAAERGDLSDSTKLKSQVARMLNDPRAKSNSIRFASEWLNLARLDNMSPNKEKFRQWKPEFAQDMRAETLAFFNELVWNQNRPLSDLFDAQFTIATDRLAKHYRLGVKGKPIAGLSTDGVSLKRYNLESVPARGGLLTQGSLLTVGGDEASMVTRGLMVMHEMMRGVVKDPPPGVDTTPVPTKAGLTQRMIATERLANPSCGGCHTKFEPLAFGLEKFDGLGTYHDKDEHKNQLREDGEVLFPGDTQPVTYASSGEMMKLFAASERVQQSVIWKLAQYSMGRPLGPADVSSVESIQQQARNAGGTYQDIMTAIVMSDLVRTIHTEETSD